MNSNLELTFLKIKIIIIPKPYSKPAKPNKKILDDIKLISSLIEPNVKI